MTPSSARRAWDVVRDLWANCMSAFITTCCSRVSSLRTGPNKHVHMLNSDGGNSGALLLILLMSHDAGMVSKWLRSSGDAANKVARDALMTLVPAKMATLWTTRGNFPASHP